MSGKIWTRTGRPFFSAQLTAALADQVRAAAEKAGLFAELGTSWLLLDAELLPWNVKAGSLLRDQYAAVGAAALASLPAAASALEQAASRGLPEAQGVGLLLERTRARLANAEAFTAAYLRYCWATDGLAGVRVAPFQLLASEGAVYHERPHPWHLALADRLAAADPHLIATTRRVEADTSDPASVAAATRWWEDLTAAGGEGMVVKPAANLTRGPHGLVQPGLKVRGREYLRIIYGPDYTEPANLVRLRQRGLSHKRSLALREYALGLEALDRVAPASPCGASTNASSPSWPWNPNPSTPGCDPLASQPKGLFRVGAQHADRGGAVRAAGAQRGSGRVVGVDGFEPLRGDPAEVAAAR